MPWKPVLLQVVTMMQGIACEFFVVGGMVPGKLVTAELDVRIIFMVQ